MHIALRRLDYFYSQHFSRQMCGVFHTKQCFSFLRKPAVVAQFNSILTQTTQSYSQTPWVKGSVPQICPHIRCQLQDSRLPTLVIGVFQHQKPILWTLTRCPTIQLISDTSSLEVAHTLPIKGSAPEDCPHFRNQSQIQLPTLLTDQL